jgi:hypothetical protein
MSRSIGFPNKIFKTREPAEPELLSEDLGLAKGTGISAAIIKSLIWGSRGRCPLFAVRANMKVRFLKIHDSVWMTFPKLITHTY